jgi:hypothetical protein
MAARRTKHKKRKKKIQERDLRGWKWLGRFQGLLAAARGRVPAGPREEHGLRRLGARQYLSLFLFGLFNPVVDSMRGLCEASHLRRVRAQTGAEGPVALSRFSEAQHVFDPELLRQVISALVEEGGAPLGAGSGGVDARALRIVDSTLWKVVPRMRWAEYGGGRGGQTQAVRLHLKLRVSDGAPAEGLISHGKLCERKALAAPLRPGEIYLGDRYYGGDYRFLAAMEKQGCGFLVRLRASAALTWESEEPLSEAERAAGLVRAGRARLGRDEGSGPWRVVRIEIQGREPVLLVASACFADMSPGEIAELYRKRWQVEQFFRWRKCLLPCRHFFAESERGVSFQIYLALIAALLLAAELGRRPGKRLMELLRFHQMGWAEDAEVERGIERDLRAARQAAARKNQA